MKAMMTSAIDVDTQLMARVQRDETSSFGDLLNRNRNLVVNYLSRTVGNKAIAEELAQDAFFVSIARAGLIRRRRNSPLGCTAPRQMLYSRTTGRVDPSGRCFARRIDIL